MYVHICRLPVTVSFTAVEAREFIFNLQCNIKRKTTPLNLNVKAMGHSIDVGVSVTNGKGEELMLTSDGGVVKSVEFGKVRHTYTCTCTCTFNTCTLYSGTPL